MFTQKIAGYNDWEIISSILQTGNSRLFSQLYYRHYFSIQKKCFSIVKNQSVAHELAHEIFAIAYEKLSTFRNSSLFSTWLYSISINHCLQYLKNKGKRTEFALLQECSDIEYEEYDDVPDNRFLLLSTVIEKLSDSDRQMFDLRFCQNLPVKAICRQLNKNESAVKMKIKRLKEHLALLLKVADQD